MQSERESNIMSGSTDLVAAVRACREAITNAAELLENVSPRSDEYHDQSNQHSNVTSQLSRSSQISQELRTNFERNAFHPVQGNQVSLHREEVVVAVITTMRRRADVDQLGNILGYV